MLVIKNKNEFIEENIIFEETGKKKIITKEYLNNVLNRLLKNSIYTFENQLKKGFFTIEGGHRIGISGEVNIEKNEVVNFRNITSLNIRIAHEVIGCSNHIINEMIKSNNEIYNTLIVAPPMCGKTTLLRDIIRNLSNGYKIFKGNTVGVIDERNEITASYNGIHQNDLGIRTDAIINIDKVAGIEMLIRSMNPKVIALDEIGMKDDLIKIEKLLLSGIKCIATMHGDNENDAKTRLESLFNRFERVIYLTNENKNFSIKEIKQNGM